MPKFRTGRRALAITSAVLALSSAIGGTANATGAAANEACGPWTGGKPGAPWYSWYLKSCINIDGDGRYYGTVYASGGSTDVRLYTGIYDSCDGRTYGLNGDSNQNHVFPSSGSTESFHVRPPFCANGYWAIARLFESGNGSPWVWSQVIKPVEA